MAGRTGYTPITNASAMQGPAQITAVYDHFDTKIGETVATVAALPASGNWTNRTVFVTADKTIRIWDGTAWVLSNFGTPYGLVRRTTATINSGANAYANMSATAAWAALTGETSPGVTYNNGWTVPVGGLYVVEWSALLLNAPNPAIMGIAVNASATPGGDQLHAAAAIVTGGAYLGTGSAHVRLVANDTLTLWGYGAGAAVSLNTNAGRGTHWGFRWVAP